MTSLPEDYFPLIAFGVFALTALLWVEWEGRIRPMFIPDAEIRRIADKLIAMYGKQAEEMARIEEDRAWRCSQNFEQGKWRRVRRQLERRGGL